MINSRSVCTVCFLAFYLLTSTVSIYAQDSDQLKLALRYKNVTAFRINDLQDIVQFGSDLQAGVEYESIEWKFIGTGRARYEGSLQQNPYHEFDGREVSLTKDDEQYSLKLGLQQVVWGKTDGFRILDVVNPVDRREITFEDNVDSRIPLWMANIELYFDRTMVQLLIIPDYASNKYADPSGEFYFQPDIPDEVAVEFLTAEVPGSNLKDWQFGIKMERQLGNWDFTFNYLHGWNSDPVRFSTLVIEPIPTIRVSQIVKRQRLFGISGDVPVASSVFRFELTFTPDNYRETRIQNNMGNTIQQRGLKLALGVDRIFENSFVSGQVILDQVIKASSNLESDERQAYLTMLYRHDFKGSNLDFQLSSAYGSNNGGSWVSPRFTYQFNGNIEGSMGLDMFDGSDSGLFGQFADRDRVFFGVEWHIK